MRWSKLIWYTVVQSLNHVWIFVDSMYCIMPVSPVLHYLLEFVQVHVHLTIHPLPPPSPFSLIFSSITVFSSELALRIMWPKYQFSSVIQSCPTLCDPMDCSMPVFPVHHQLSEFAQTNVDLVGDVIRSSHPLPPTPPAFNLSQHQGLFKWVSSSHQVAQSIGVSASTSVLPMNTQDWSLGWTGWISLQSKGFSRVFSSTTVQKHQFLRAQLFLYSNSQIYIWLLEKP